MAKMIPAQFDASTVSAAERRVFDLLKNDPETKDWIVLHSLGLSKRGKKPYGEIDFVVLIPATAILCLEVKGGGVSCHDGQWITTNRFGVTEILNRSPFLQAREGMFALRESVQNRAPTDFPAELLCGYAVVMPDVSFSIRSPEWESWQAIDHDALKKPISAVLKRVALETRKLHPNAASGEPKAATLRILQQFLRPDFEVVVTRGTQIEETELQLLQLTEEQYATLDTLADNERCLVEGAAGTGKTMLALEYARRCAMAGRRTLLICFNRLLGDWLDRQAHESGYSQNLVAGRYFKLLRDVIVRSSLATEFQEEELRGQTEELYTSVYTDCGRLAVEEQNQPFDVIVMDEAQDLLRPGVLEVLNAWVKGGFADGCWAVFGDFHRQAIYGSTTGDQLKALIKERVPHYARGRLTLNCRNTRNIGEETALLSGFASPPYRMGQVAGLPVDYHYYQTPEAQKTALSVVLKRMLGDGIKASDIVVVSSAKLFNSGVAGVNGGDHFRVVEIADWTMKARIPAVRFATVQAFKGMESPVIVLCDVEHVTDGEPQCLLYVAMSRARSQLTVLVHERTKTSIMECIRRKLQEGWNKNP